MSWDKFFELHKDLPREGPGCSDDVRWAMGLAKLGLNASVADVAAGPGGDSAALLECVPQGHVLAVDKWPGFVAQMRDRFADLPDVTPFEGDMADIATLPGAPFDGIWCAGGLYFLGLEAGLATMHDALRQDGVLMFSEPCFFTDAPSDRAIAFWDGYPTRTVADVAKAIAAAGFVLVAQRPVSDAAWEAYFQPIDERIEMLRPNADKALSEILHISAQEAAIWRAHSHETGYVLSVARKR